MRRKSFTSTIRFILSAGLIFLAFIPNKVNAGSLTSVSDTMTRLQVSIVDVPHSIKFTPENAINQDDGVQITITSNFGDASLDITDYSIAQGAGGTACASWTENTYVPANDVIQFECDTIGAAGTGEITVTITTDLDNPASAAEEEFLIETYDLGADGDFAGGDDALEDSGQLSISIVDDDTVNITSYLDTVMTFDIDTTELDEDCDAAGGASPCDSHGGATDNAGYVVDLGQLSIASVNDSGTSVLHSDGLNGTINSIWFDIETNASGGAVVTVVSLREALYLDGSNQIPDVADGSEQQITAGSGLYGINVQSGFTNSTSSGTLVIQDDCDCDSGDTYFCDISDGGTPIQIFNTNSAPVDGGRLQFGVGASPDLADGTGTYTDELTFVATPTF
jgi:hypothetical protein